MPQRFRDVGHTIYEFGDTFLVRCPRCQQCARIIRLHPPAADTFQFQQLFDPRRCVCSHCGYIQEWHVHGIHIGGPCDWYFGLPLWLQTPCCGHTLWAYNEAHLRFLEQYVGADLRERLPNPHTNRSLASRLPQWMKSAKHRAAVTDGLSQLRELLA